MAIDLSKSGWENPDSHKAPEARPMFGPDGEPIQAMPEPDPLTPAELAMFKAQLEATAGQPAKIMPAGSGVMTTPLPDHVDRLASIRKVAEDALTSEYPARWAAALDKIQDLAS